MGQVYQRADALLFGPADLRDLRQLLGNGLLGGKSGQQPDLSGIERAAQVRGIEHAQGPAMGGHDRPLRRRRGCRRELKAKSAGELQVHGSGNLVRWLLDNHLVDEITLRGSN
jgi:hypothetical protein